MSMDKRKVNTSQIQMQCNNLKNEGKKKSMKQAFQTSDLSDAIIQTDNRDRQKPEIHSPAHHHSSWYPFHFA